MRPDVVCDLGDVGIVKSGIDLIQNEEGRGLIAKQVVSYIHLALRYELTYEWQKGEPRLRWFSHHQRAVPYPGNVS